MGKGMTGKQLDDLVAFIGMSVRDKKDEGYILLNVLHDLVGISNNEKCFLPRTTGYSKMEKEQSAKEK